MDTRTKIIPGAEAERLSSNSRALWVRGSFDPLLSEHANTLRRLAKTGQVLIVWVSDPDRPLMPRRARAELVAGISAVDYVVMDALPSQAENIDEPRIRAEFIERVIVRHRTEAAR